MAEVNGKRGGVGRGWIHEEEVVMAEVARRGWQGALGVGNTRNLARRGGGC